MKQCQTPGCGGLAGAICTGADQWIRFCPICKTKQAIQPPRQPDEADGLAVRALVDLQRANYAVAEKGFLDAAGKTAQDASRQAFYLWCSLIARYGVEYVQEVQFESIPARRSALFVPTFGRFPLPDHRIMETEACQQLDMLLLGLPEVNFGTYISELDILLRDIEQCMHNEQNEFDVFIAWHDRVDNNNGPCHNFADRLNSSLNAHRDCYSFVSFRSLHHVVVDRYEPHIYAALASAKVMVIVIDDYDALGKKFLASEIKRFASRQLQDQSLQIYFCGMKDHIGRLPAYMVNWQLHQQQCENEDVWVNLITNEVMDVLRWSREHAKPEPKPEPKPVPEPAPAPSPRPAEKKPPVLHKTALIALFIAAILLLAVLLTGSSSTDQKGNSLSGKVTNASDQNVPNHQGAAGDNGSSAEISTDTNTSAGSSGSGLSVSQSDDISFQSTGGIQQDPPKLAGYGTVNTDSIYMRRNPWREDNNVARHIAHAGTSVYVYELVTNQNEDWYKVSYDGVEGYIPARYVDINNSISSTYSTANQRLPGYGTVNTDSIYIRRNPWRADNNVAIRVAHAGTSVYVYELVTNKNEDWYKVSYNGVEGYVLAQYVDLN